jgi:hypothetical protein
MLDNDRYPYFSHLTQTQIGHYFGVTAAVVGRWLKEVGLRGSDGFPASTAVAAGDAERRSISGTDSFWVWRKDQVVSLLEAAGHRRVSAAATAAPPPNTPVAQPASPSAPSPLPPHNASMFVRARRDGWHEIVWPDHVARTWVEGEDLARQVAGVLTLALKFGKVRGGP